MVKGGRRFCRAWVVVVDDDAGMAMDGVSMMMKSNLPRRSIVITLLCQEWRSLT